MDTIFTFIVAHLSLIDILVAAGTLSLGFFIKDLREISLVVKAASILVKVLEWWIKAHPKFLRKILRIDKQGHLHCLGAGQLVNSDGKSRNKGLSALSMPRNLVKKAIQPIL